MERPSVAALLDLGRLETVFQSLLDRVDSQAAEVAALRAELERRPTAEQFTAALQAAEERIARVERRSAQLEADTRATGLKAGVGACVAANQQAIAGLLGAVANKADSERLAAVAETSLQAVDALGTALRRERAEKSVVNMLESSQRELQGQLAGLEQVVAGKMNRSDVSRLEAAATRLLDFEAFSERVAATAEAAAADRAGLHGQVDEALAACASLTATTGQLRVGLDRAATGAALQGLRQELAAVAATADAAAPAAAVAVLDARVGASERHVGELRGGARDAGGRTDARFAQLEAAVAERATLAQLALCADNATSQRQWAALRAALERKAGATTVAAIEEAVAALTTQLAQTDRQADLAARFVDWFSERGESYEHNFRILEGQLGKLATRSRPDGPEQQPYDGRVRY